MTLAAVRSGSVPGVIGSLLAPLAPDVFFQDFWEQRHCLVSRCDPGSYAGLLTMSDVDALLYQYRHGASATGEGARVTLVKHSQNDALRRPVPTNESGQLDSSALYDAYVAGYTLVVDMVHTCWAPVATLCQGLETFLSCPVQANVYVSPRGAQGFAAHFDTHDVFVLQLAGSKHWRIYGDGEALPMRGSHQDVSREAGQSPIAQFVLEQGDLLYIPRGVVHEAVTSENSSMHLTIGMHAWRWADFLREAISHVADQDLRFRRSLPIGIFSEDRRDLASLGAQFTDLLHASAAAVNCRDVLDRMQARFIDAREPAPDGHFANLDRLDTLASETYLRRRAGLLCSVVLREHRATIAFPGCFVSGPGYLERAFRFIAQADAFRPCDLPGPSWAPLSAAAQLTIAKRLIRAGLLAVGDLPVHHRFGI